MDHACAVGTSCNAARLQLKLRGYKSYQHSNETYAQEVEKRNDDECNEGGYKPSSKGNSDDDGLP